LAELQENRDAVVRPAVRRRARWGCWAAAVLALLLAIGIGVAIHTAMTWGYFRPAVHAPENRPQPRTPEEEIVKRFILNNADDDATKVRFLTWGPHMYKPELASLVQESGIDRLVRHDQETEKKFKEMFKEFDAIVRVRYRGPHSTENDMLFMVIGGKLVLPMGHGSDDWKKELRKHLSKIFPGIERD
jgi:hypothetical protein